MKNPDVVEENTERTHLPEAAKLGGRAVVEKYGSEHMAEIGRKGSRAVVKRYGLRFYSEIAARNRLVGFAHLPMHQRQPEWLSHVNASAPPRPENQPPMPPFLSVAMRLPPSLSVPPQPAAQNPSCTAAASSSKSGPITSMRRWPEARIFRQSRSSVRFSGCVPMMRPSRRSDNP